jgi:hypothetical protein
LQLSFSIVDLRLRVLQARSATDRTGLGCVAVRQQLTLSFEVAARVSQLSLCGDESRFRRAQRIELILWIKLGQYLSRLDAVTDIYRSLDHPPSDTKGERGLVFGVDVPG